MSMWEASVCVENLQYIDREFRELMRYSICATYNSNPFLKHPVKLQDIFDTPWDSKAVDYNAWKQSGGANFNEDEVPEQEMLDAQKERMKAFIQGMEKQA